MIEIFIKNCEFFKCGKFKTLTFTLHSKFSNNVEFEINLKKSNVFESSFNFVGNNYKMICKVKALNYYDIMGQGLTISTSNEFGQETSISNTKLSLKYDDTRDCNNYNLQERKSTDSTEDGSLLTSAIRNPGRFLKYNFYLDSLTLFCEKVRFENKNPKPDYIYNVNTFILNKDDKLLKTNFIRQIDEKKLNYYNKYISQFIYGVVLEFYPNCYQSPKYYKKSDEFILEIGRNISKSTEQKYKKEIFDIINVNLKTVRKNNYEIKEIQEQFTLPNINEFYISFNNENLFGCLFSNKVFYNVYTDDRTIYLFVFNLDDFVQINYKLFFNSKIDLISKDGNPISFDFTNKVSQIYWETYRKKIFMFVNVRNVYNSELNNDVDDIYKTINTILIENDISKFNNSILELNSARPTNKSKFENFFEDTIESQNLSFNEYNDSRDIEYRLDEDWNGLDRETKLQVDPMRYIDEGSIDEEERERINERDEYMMEIYEERENKYFEKVKNIEIIVLEFELYSLELIKLKILLPPKYAFYSMDDNYDDRLRNYEISSMFMFRVLNFQSYDFSTSYTYIGVIKNDFFIADLYAKTKMENLNKIFNQPLKLICDNKEFKLYKGDYKNINLKHIITNTTIKNKKVNFIDDSSRGISTEGIVV